MAHVSSDSSDQIVIGIQVWGLIWVFSDCLYSLGLLVIVCCLYLPGLWGPGKVIICYVLYFLVLGR